MNTAREVQVESHNIRIQSWKNKLISVQNIHIKLSHHIECTNNTLLPKNAP